MRLNDVLARVPTGYDIRMGWEYPEGDDDCAPFFGAVLMKLAPDGGWEDDCAQFGHVPKVHAKGAKCGWKDSRIYIFDDRCIFGVSGKDVRTCLRLFAAALDKEFGGAR